MKRALFSTAVVFSVLVSASCQSEIIIAVGGRGGAEGDATTTSGSDGGPGEPPSPPSGPAGDGSGPVVIAMTQLRIGVTDMNGTPSTNAWASYGFNLDGDVTSTDFTHHCKPANGASPKDVFPDGMEGRDNAWGKKLLPLFVSAAGAGTDLESQWNQPIASGQSTFLVDLPNLGTKSYYAPLTAYGLGGRNQSGDAWQIAPETLGGSTPESSTMKFPDAYLTANTFVGRGATVSLDLGPAGSFVLHLKIHQAIVAAALSPDHQTATNGTIAGILDTEEFVAMLKKEFGWFSSDLCQGGAIDSILNQVRQASDILVDGTQDASKTCNGITIGLGFSGVATQLGSVAAPLPPETDPCENF